MERENIVHFRANENEKQLLKRLAERDGQTISSWLRAQIHKEARRYGIEGQENTGGESLIER